MRILKNKWQLDEVVKYIRHDINFKNGNYEKENCRWANKSTQQRNTRKLISTNKSGYRGVTWHKAKKKWNAQIKVNYKRIHLGSFLTALDGAKAYDKYVIDNNLEHTINGV